MVEVVNRTRTAFPRLPLEYAANRILGGGYSLSVVVVGEDRIRALNVAHRGMDKPTDVLSFPLSKDEGEIFVCPRYVAAHTSKYADYGWTSKQDTLNFILIHAMLHLAGYDHGSRMESEERSHMRAVASYVKKHRSRN